MPEQMMLLVLQLGVILIAAFVGGKVSERLGFPGVLGELAAGMIIGPHLVGRIALPFAHHGLFPNEGPFPVSPELYGFAMVGSVLLLFLVGLETNMKMFVKYALAGSLVGAGGALVSFAFSDLTTVLFYRHVFGVECSMLSPIPLFLGIVSAATSVGISARILSENRKVDSPEGVTILSGAVIDDIIGVMLLAVVLGVVQSGAVDWQRAAGLFGGAVFVFLGFTVVVFALARTVSKRFRQIQHAAPLAILCLAGAFIAASLFENIGLAMIIGAYATGLALSQTPWTFQIQSQLANLYKFFVPLFFCVMGMLVDFGAVMDSRVIIFEIIYTVVAVVAKLIGCSIPCLALGYSGMGALRVGLGMIPRGEVALIIAAIGLSTGGLDEEAFAMAMFMTVATTMVTPPLLVMSLRSSQPTLRTSTSDPEEAPLELVYPFPSPAMTDLMHARIMNEMQQDGFSIHLLDIDSRTYHVSRDEISFGMEVSAYGLRFEGQESDGAFIRTLMFDTLSDVAAVISQMRKGAAADELRRHMLDTNSPNAGFDSGEEWPVSDAPVVVLHGETKREVLEELLTATHKEGTLDEAEASLALDDILRNEENLSSAMAHGVAVPHAKTFAVKRLVCTVGLHRVGVAFDSPDADLTHIVALVLVPKGRPTAYRSFIAGVVDRLSNEHVREKLLSSIAGPH